MAKDASKRTPFTFNYWVAIMFEFFERGSYYGVMSILSVYMTDQLGFSKEGVGVLKSTIQPILYFLPILTGAIADRMGYRKTLLAAFSLLGLGYFFAAGTTEYVPIFLFLIVMAVGAGTFKPIISGTIARATDKTNSTLGFGIFYWSINLGALLFPLIIVPILKSIDQSYVLYAAAIGTGAMIIPTIFMYKEPERDEGENTAREPIGKMMKDVFEKVYLVFLDFKFILFIALYSMFWILYFQMFDTVLWYVRDFVDAAPLNDFISGVLGFDWKFDVEHVTVINAFTIFALQLLISPLVKNTKALPTIVTGVAIGTVGMAMLALSTNIWVFMAGITIFSIGEMTAHPKYISYLGLIAPADKKATYMGFGFLYGFFGSLIGGVLGAKLYVWFIDNPMIDFVKAKMVELNATTSSSEMSVEQALETAKTLGIAKEQVASAAYTSELWLLFSGIGVLCIVSLLLYDKFVGTRDAE